MSQRVESFKRKFPRRNFFRAVGCLCAGEYFVGSGVEIGEGGIAFNLGHDFTLGQEVVISFQIPGGSFVCVRAELKNSAESQIPGHFTVGCLFQNLKFEQKREIRSFVSARSEEEH